MKLSVNNLIVTYGKVVALQDISFTVREGDISVILGANGAGKSTILKTIMGIHKCKSGNVVIEPNKQISKLAPHDIHRSGIAWVPEGRGIYTTLTVLENLQIGGFTKDAASNKKQIEKVFSIFPLLKERQNQLGTLLSGGEQQMLAIGRALMSSPELILMDEPSLGLAPIVVDSLFKTIKRINMEEGTSILMVEQNARQALGIAKWAFLLENGKIVREGTANEMELDKEVQKAYFGG